jgi:hypothetical protein
MMSSRQTCVTLPDPGLDHDVKAALSSGHRRPEPTTSKSAQPKADDHGGSPD